MKKSKLSHQQAISLMLKTEFTWWSLIAGVAMFIIPIFLYVDIITMEAQIIDYKSRNWIGSFKVNSAIHSTVLPFYYIGIVMCLIFGLLLFGLNIKRYRSFVD